jgi:GT2 family glycosyltransferase
MVTDRTWFGLARRVGIELSLEGALEPWSGRHDYAQVLLIGDDGEPLEWLLLARTDVSDHAILEHWDGMAAQVRLAAPSLPPGDLSVAVCTRERPDSLGACLSRLRRALCDEHEVVVVDNAPTSGRTAQVVASFADAGMWIRRVLEPARGLSRARNRALSEATTTYVAFTDDDARPDAGWATALRRGFGADAQVAVVTGMVPPAQIETPAQALFEKKLKWSASLSLEIYRMADRDRYVFPFPYSAGHFGTGANFAVDRAAIIDLGGFDEALGAGTPAAGGEDMELFVRVLRRGHTLVYQPAAIVWHVHRREDEDLRRLLFGYGKGLSAAALSEFLQPGKVDMVRGSLQGARNLARERHAEVGYGMPRHHLALEMAGVVCGPGAYLWERWRGVRS